jgi:glycosyltransferase involved in cell wall biosynthesis
LHLIGTGGPGGAETVLANVVENLNPDEFASRTLVPDRDWLYNRLVAGEQDVGVLRTHRSLDLPFLWRLVREIKRFDADVLHAHLLGSSVYGSIAAQIRGNLPVIATFHGLPDIWERDRLLPAKAAILSRKRNHIVFVADHLRFTLQARLGLPDRACRTIHNGLRFSTEPIRSPQVHTRTGRRKVGALGNVRPAKDYPTLLNAAKHVCTQIPDVDFYIGGSGSAKEMKVLHELRDALQLTERVFFQGFVNDVQGFLLGLDVFVCSSRTEGLPLAVCEAAGLGCPIVATSCSGNLEVLNGLGSLVPPGDPVALAREISSALADPVRVRAEAERLAADVRERFGMERMIDRYSSLYRLAVTPHHRSTSTP